MSLTRIAATGRGRISARLVIEGLEHEFVTDKRMEQSATSDGRVRVRGLDTETLTIGASADMMRATLRGTGLTARIRDMDRAAGQRHGRVTRGLWRSPTVRGFLAADISKTATTITLRDAAAFPAAGVVHIGTEAIAYAGKSATQLTGCTRGHWQTIAQAHFVADGEGLADALVTDQPIGIEGRRAYLYLYGDGPASVAQGDGSLRWRGICATDVTWSEGVCEIAIDPISRLLDQPIGGDAGGSIGIRGIHYTSASPWGMEIHDLSALSEKIARVRMVGFYADQATFNTAANAAIDSALTAASISLGTGSSLRLVDAPGGYVIEYTTATASPVPITVVLRSDMPNELTRDFDAWQDSTGRRVTTLFDRTWTPDVTTRYAVPVVGVPFPRATVGRGGWERVPETPSATASYFLLYLGGLQMPTALSGLTIAGAGYEDLRPLRVESTLPSVRAVYLTPGTLPSRLIVIDGTAEIRVGRVIASGSVLDLAAQLVVDSPTQANTGAMPLVAAGEIGWTGDLDDAVATQPLAQGRGFVSFEDAFTLSEFVTPELLVLGAYQRIALDGSLEWARLAQALSTDSTAWTLTDADVGARPRIERGPRGVLGQVLYRLEYDPREDEWARAITFRDVQSTSATRTPITLEIAQRSTSSGTLRAGDEWSRIDRSVLARAAMGAFGIFGVPTVAIEVATDARYMDARIGDVVQLSSSLLPDPETGYTAIAGRAGVIVGHQLECRTGAVSLSIMVSTQRVVGYAPEFLVASSAPYAGTTWDVTVTLGTGYTQSTDVADWLAAGDLVRVLEGNDATPTEVLGTIVSLQSATVVRVAFASAWVPGSSEWTLRARNAGDYAAADRLAGFAFVAGTDGRIGYSDGDVDTKVFS